MANESEARRYNCTNCGGEVGSVPGVPCKQCGDTRRTISLSIVVKVHALASMRGVMRDPKKKGRYRRAVEFIEGWSFSRDLGRHVRLSQRVDRIAKWYSKRLVDHDGTVIRECEEPLYDHIGRGDAKLKAKKQSIAETREN